jgi:uncharacterized protein with HEPN domain
LTSPDTGFLRDMLASAGIALRYAGSMDVEEFLDDVKTQDATLWRLAVIGEAANHVSPATCDAIPLPWADIIGQRHVAIHHYRKLHMHRIWSTVREHLPGLVTELEAYLSRTSQ